MTVTAVIRIHDPAPPSMPREPEAERVFKLQRLPTRVHDTINDRRGVDEAHAYRARCHAGLPFCTHHSNQAGPAGGPRHGPRETAGDTVHGAEGD